MRRSAAEATATGDGHGTSSGSASATGCGDADDFGEVEEGEGDDGEPSLWSALAFAWGRRAVLLFSTPSPPRLLLFSTPSPPRLLFSSLFSSRLLPLSFPSPPPSPPLTLLLSSSVQIQASQFEFIALMPFTKGAELFTSYGPKVNEELLLGYGFVLDGNK
ncbi:unnamed protein product [Closterium sp. Naga37s-1]|nr:unnamed protein product [Closterium sp. Naga37s-1]CAI5506282.1 unnamed protein product [Closterium sp. Naga37s-1]